MIGKKLDLLLYTGTLLLKCLADSNRIDRNLRRVATYMGIPEEQFNMHVTYTTLIINISDGDHSVTKIRKVKRHHVDLNALAEISKLTWKALQSEHMSLEEYEREILAIGKLLKVYPAWLAAVSAGAACGSFACLFGADWPAMLIAAVAASSASLVQRALLARKINSYMTVAATAFIAALIAILARDFSNTPNHSLIASVLFLIPGVPLINSVDDLIDGFTMTGVTRAATATINILAISFGMIMAMWALSYADFESATQPHSSILAAVAAAIAAIGFGIRFNVPMRALIGCAVGGATAVSIRNILFLYSDMGLPLASFAGAICVGVITVYGMHLSHVPANVLTVPSVIPMIPGVVMYDAMMGLIRLNNAVDYNQTEVLTITVRSGVTACLVIMGIAFGIALPNTIERHFFAIKGKIFRKRA